MNVVITEAGSANNVGSMALIENAVNIIKKRYDEVEIYIMCADPISVKETLILEGFNLKNIVVTEDLFTVPNNKFRKYIWLLSSILWIYYAKLVLIFTTRIENFVFGQRKMLLAQIRNADVVICIGAERINDIYYKIEFFSLHALHIYEKMGKDLLHFSLTIGPVFHKWSIKFAKKVLNNSKAILVRDQKSFDLLIKWEINKPKIFNSYDIALFQRQSLRGETIVYNQYKLVKEKPIIAISVINWRFKYANGPSKFEDYIYSVAKAADYLIEKYNYQILFTPTLVGEENAIDDILASNYVFNKMKYKKNATIIESLLSPSDLTSVFSVCKFGIVTRMHAAILSSGGAGTPIIAINYLYKLREYMKNIDSEEFSIDIDNVNEAFLIKAIDNLNQNYEYIKVKLFKKIILLKNILDSHIDNALN